MIKRITITPKYPNQQLNFQSPTQNITIYLNWRGYVNLPTEEQDFVNAYSKPQFFADVFIQNSAVVVGCPVVNMHPINQYPTALNGYIIAVGDTSPTLENLGVTTQLYWIDNLSELENIK